jgi:predicted PurR-regulated permease PerM
MTLLDIPNPMLWGAIVGILNFAPYAGAATSLLIMTMIGMLTFDDISQAFLVPGVTAAILFTTSQIIIPLVLGRRLLLSPVAIFIAIMVWGWLWGILGALLAVPLLASFKIICERIESLQPVAEFLTP